MERFQTENPTEPRGRAESGYSIRASPDWDSVAAKLQDAREEYDNPKGMLGTLKKGIRRGVDHSYIVRGALGFVPDMDYVTPVKAAFKVILDVSASRVGNFTLKHGRTKPQECKGC